MAERPFGTTIGPGGPPPTRPYDLSVTPTVVVLHGDQTGEELLLEARRLLEPPRTTSGGAIGPQTAHLAKVTGGRCVYAPRRPGDTIVP